MKKKTNTILYYFSFQQKQIQGFLTADIFFRNMNNFTAMKREHWGELSDGSNLKKELKSSDICQTGQKWDKLKQLQTLKTESKEVL